MKKTILIGYIFFLIQCIINAGCYSKNINFERIESVTNAIELHTKITDICGKEVHFRHIEWKDLDDGSMDIICKKCSVIFAWEIKNKGYLPLTTNRQVDIYKGVKIEHGLAYYPRPMDYKNYMISFYHKKIYFILYMQIPGEPNVHRNLEHYFPDNDFEEKGLNLAKWIIDYFDRKL